MSVTLPPWMALPSHMLCLLAGVVCATFWHQSATPPIEGAKWKKETFYLSLTAKQVRGKIPLQVHHGLSLLLPTLKHPPCRISLEKSWLAQRDPFPVLAVPLKDAKGLMEKLEKYPTLQLTHAVEGELIPICIDKPEVRYGALE